MEKGASKYSYICSAVNHIPKATVIIKAFHVSIPFPSRNLWWDHVSEAPEDSRIAVLRRGTPHG